MGATLIEAVTSLLAWADAHLGDIDVARARYDQTRQVADQIASSRRAP